MVFIFWQTLLFGLFGQKTFFSFGIDLLTTSKGSIFKLALGSNY